MYSAGPPNRSENIPVVSNIEDRHVGNRHNGVTNGAAATSGASSTPMTERFITSENKDINRLRKDLVKQDAEIKRLLEDIKQLEYSLEEGARKRENLTETLENREKEWQLKYKQMVEQLDRSEAMVKKKEDEIRGLKESVGVTHMQIQKFLKKKWNLPKDLEFDFTNVLGDWLKRNEETPTENTDRGRTGADSSLIQSPQYVLDQTTKNIKVKHAENMLLDFFAMN